MKKILIVLAICLIGLASCSKKNDVFIPYDYEMGPDTVVVITHTDITKS